MTLYDDVVTKVDKLSVNEKVRLIEHLGSTLQHDLEVESYRRMPWHEFLKRTYGILADDPIERPPQLPLEEREPLE